MLTPLLLSWCSVRRRIQFFAALLSIALQASDLVLGGWGHRHSHDAADVHACHSECDGHEHGGQADEFDSEDGLPVEHHDDCSLCRHFSQAAVPVSVETPVVTCERVAPLFIHLVAAAGVDVEIAHPARGPPASVA
jgi:hypothetical protein